jgi:serine protease AprX
MLGTHKNLRTAVWLLVALCGSATMAHAGPRDHRKLDGALNERVNRGAAGKSRVIVTFKPGWDAAGEAKKLNAKLGRRLGLIDGQVVEVSNDQLKKLADNPNVESVSWDRPTLGLPTEKVTRKSPNKFQRANGLKGAGIGVAVIDSGITPWHDDLSVENGTKVESKNGQRVVSFVDFVNGFKTPYDDYGHGTFVAGIIAGNGKDSGGDHVGVAPESHLMVLKVLDANGRGNVSDVIAAIDYAVQNRLTYNIRVINLSIAAAVFESYKTDPLTLAAKRATDAGMVVVAAAGNLGKNPKGEAVYGGITAPGNAPWVLTVGAYNDMGTPNRADDTVAAYSSRGPTALDFIAKPDLVAPGTGIVSISDPGSTLYSKDGKLVDGTSGLKQYMSLTGTSVAAPAVSGTVALMLQGNPALTPNLVKAILQYTATPHPQYDVLTQGAGFLDEKSAVQLAVFFAKARRGQKYPADPDWGRQIIWGNQLITGGVLMPNANAWALNIVWGTRCSSEDCDNIVWGTRCSSEDCDNIVWGTMFSEDLDNIVWGTSLLHNEDLDNIVWGTMCGGEDCDNIVWGTAIFSEDGDNIVWGTMFKDLEDLDNIVWGTSLFNNEDLDNIVWGTMFSEDLDNIVWGTSVTSSPASLVSVVKTTGKGK